MIVMLSSSNEPRISDSQVLLVRIPDAPDLPVEVSVELVPVDEGKNDGLEGFRVHDGLDHGIRVPHQVVEEVDAPWLGVVHYNLTEAQEEVVNHRVLLVELTRSLDAARALVNLEGVEELGEQLVAFSSEVVLVKVNDEVLIVSLDFELKNLGLLVLVDELGDYVRRLAMGLTPLLGLWVVLL